MNTVHLIGAEDVKTAGFAMSHAASEMSRAANLISDSLLRHQQFMDEWLLRFQQALPEPKAEAKP